MKECPFHSLFTDSFSMQLLKRLVSREGPVELERGNRRALKARVHFLFQQLHGIQVHKCCSTFDGSQDTE